MRPDEPRVASFRRDAPEEVRQGPFWARNPGPGASRLWGTVVSNPLNVVDGKLLAPPRGTALYYIANREKGF